MRQSHGEWFEQYLEHLHQRYAEAGRARVDKVPTPTRAVNTPHGLKFIPTQRGISDYLGVLRGGQAVAFDAKATSNKTRWHIRTGGARSRGSEHQWEYLRQVHELRGVAFFLVYAYEIERMFIALMPFPLAPMRFADMPEVSKDRNGWFDWLTTLEGLCSRIATSSMYWSGSS